MRLRRLRLTRFGRFEDFEVDFGPKPADGPDFHVVYGLNEAGKTTFLSAVMRLLHGFPRRGEPYDFRHGADLEVGADVEGLSPGGPLFVRRVRAGDALLDAAGRSLPADLFATALGGLSAEEHARVYALDRAGVEAAAADMKNARSDAARLLFAAHAGLGALSAALDRVEAEAAALFLKRGRVQKGAELRRRLGEIDEAIRDADISPARYDALAGEAAQAAQASREAARTVAGARAAQEGAARLADIRDRRAALSTLEARLAEEFAGAPDWPGPPHRESLAALAAAGATARADLRRLDAAAERLAEERAGLALDPAVLALEGPIAALEGEKGLRSLAEGALRDLPRRREAAERAAAEIARLLAPQRRDPTAPLRGDLMLAPEAVEALRAALGARDRARAALETAAAERLTAQTALTRLEAEQAHADAPAPLDGATAAALAGLEPGRVLAEAAEAARDLARAEAAAGAALDALHLPGRAMAAPPETALTPGAVRAAAAALARLRQEAETRAAALAEAARDLEGRRAELAEAAGTMDAAALDPAASRAARESAWARHRGALDAATADAFEAAMRADDAAQALRLAQGAALGRLDATRAEIARLAARLDADAPPLDAARAGVAKAEAQARAARAALALPEAMTDEELADWLDRARAARQADATLARERTRTQPALAARAEAAARARAALPELEGTSDTAALEQAQARLAAQATAAAAAREAARALTRARDALRDRAGAETEAQTALASAERGWAQAVAANLPADHDLADPALALRALDAASREAAVWRSLRRQVETMAADAAAFAAEIARLSQALEAPPPGEGTAAALACGRALAARLAAARAARDRDAEIATALAELAAERAAAEAALTRAEAGMDLYRARFPADADLADLTALEAAVAAAVEATRLRGEAAGLRRALAAASASARVAGLDPDAPFDPDAATQSAAALAEAEAARERADRRHGAAEQALRQVDGSETVARLRLDRAAVEEALRETALEHARKRLGLRLAREALETYRKTHRGAMMRRADEAFARLTRGRYADLTSRPEGAAPVLVARCVEDGVTRRAEDMSEGTRMQLHFALRAAAYAARAEAGAALPFIADDVFESFDDHRTEAACAEMLALGRLGQTLYLTHHFEVVERALRAGADPARIHFLPGAPDEDRARLRRAL